MDDQVGEGTRYAKFGEDRFTAVFWGDVRFFGTIVTAKTMSFRYELACKDHSTEKAQNLVI